jgi:hypothetical protein
MKILVSVMFALLTWTSALAAGPEIVSVNPAVPHEVWQQRLRDGVRGRGRGSGFERAEVAQYEKLELNVDLKATFDNPFDPEQIDLSAEFTSPSGKVTKVWGFYNPGRFNSLWMIRFTPTETGDWKYIVKVRDRDGIAASEVNTFKCASSTHHGFLTIAPNKRYWQYSDGASFYGVGLWYNDNYTAHDQGFITEEGLDGLKQHGANFICFYPSPLETFGTGLGRYDLDRAGRLDELFDWCEKRDLAIAWNLVFHAQISEEVWGRGNTEFRQNPYRTITSAKDFFASEAAWKQQEKLYRYIIARWGYSRALFLWFVVDEINGTEGWTEGDHAVAEAWCTKMRDFIHEHDPYGRPTTGTQSGSIENWWPGGYEIFDVAAREIYEGQGHPMPKSGKPDVINDNPLQYSYRNYATQVQKLWSGFDKPAIIGESGWDWTYYEPGTPGYLAIYHNALWASLANGAAATPFWWDYSPMINDSVLTGQLRAFSQFVRDIDFAKTEWQPAKVEVTTGDGWAMKSDETIFGWIANPMSGVAKESFTISGLVDGDYDIRLYRTWTGRYLERTTATAAEGKLTISIPEVHAREGRVQSIGDDIAFKITKRDILPSTASN